jgi:hypothetical protein
MLHGKDPRPAWPQPAPVAHRRGAGAVAAGPLGTSPLVAGAVVAAALAAFAAAGPARAADPPAAPPPEEAAAPPAKDWRFQATLYGWMTAVDGDLGIRNLPTVPVNASLSDVLQDLDGAVMGSFAASNGNWLFLADLVLARLSNKQTVGRFGRSRLSAELTEVVASGAVGYVLPLGVPGVEVAATAGVRYVNLSTEARLRPALLPSRSASGTQSWVDPTIGFAAHWAIDEKWFVNAIADIGGFGVGSELSSSGYLGVGYMWTPSISSAIGYRYLYEDYQNRSNGNNFRYDTTMHGPTVSLAWHF